MLLAIICYMIENVIIENKKLIFEKKIIFNMETIILLSYPIYYWAHSKVMDDSKYLSNINAIFFIVLFIVTAINRKYKNKEINFIFNKIIFIVSLLSILFIIFNVNSTDRCVTLFFNKEYDPNYASINLIIPIILCFSKILETSLNIKKKLIYLLLVLPITFLLILLGSRGVTISVILGILIIFVNSILKRKQFKKAIIIVASLIFIILLSIKFIPTEVIQRFNYKSLMEGGGGARLEIWLSAIDKFKEEGIKQKIIGNGLGSFIDIVNIKQYGQKMGSHNIIISSLIDGGIIGVGIVCSIFIILFKRAYSSKNIIAFALLSSIFISRLTLDFSTTFWENIMLAILILKSKIYLNKTNILEVINEDTMDS